MQDQEGRLTAALPSATQAPRTRPWPPLRCGLVGRVGASFRHQQFANQRPSGKSRLPVIATGWLATLVLSVAARYDSATRAITTAAGIKGAFSASLRDGWRHPGHPHRP